MGSAAPMQEPHRRYNRSVGQKNSLRRALCVLFVFALSAVPPPRAQEATTSVAPPPALLSRQLATRAHVKVGDEVTLASDAAGTAGRTFRVVGIYEPTPDPMRFPGLRRETGRHR